MPQARIPQNGPFDARVKLPESYDVNWTPARKAEVVKAVRDKLISFDEARWRYLLSQGEFKSWQQDLAKKGERNMDFEIEEVS
ncbi:DUF1153 domain-containing protein [Altererythrobacter sp. MF3-039]|uniref:DUF1153 domain-containing protein n=1 Tax=Altererythrobacter sp. MF3-039 TaxID=3252901 RepID=UPI00390C4543